MISIKGKYTSAKIFTDIIEEEAKQQIKNVCDNIVFKNETIRIMPDVHAGQGCVIGFTATCSNNKIIPNLIGVDIGCGMLTAELGKVNIDLAILDEYILRNIPHGYNTNKVNTCTNMLLLDQIYNTCLDIKQVDKLDYHFNSLGSLGGGNHFIELNKDDEDNVYMVIHSGARNFGHRVASYYQDIALSRTNNGELSYLENNEAVAYKHNMKIAQKFASTNRYIMMRKILDFLNIAERSMFETVHNYIDNNIIRKGAISADKGEKVLIPLNMRDGSILATGKGNKDWLCSAPHGAGRVLSRTKAKKELSLDDFKTTMQGIYTSSISLSTLDEAPAAYKNKEDILNNIAETVEINAVLKPIYNFKAR